MMQYEFESLAGYKVSYEDYVNILEPMYMATDLPKDEFVKCINKKRFALPSLESIIKNMQQCAESLYESCTHYTDWDEKEKLNHFIEEYIQRRFGEYSKNMTYGINEKERFTCYYPVSVDIYSDRDSFKRVERIQLI